MRRAARRLRTPRYAIGLVLAVLWLLSLAGTRGAGGEGRAIGALTDGPGLLPALGLAVAVLVTWLMAGGRRALAFSPADIALLVPAPLSRRALLALRIAQAQPAIVLSSVLLVAFFGPPEPLRAVLLGASSWMLATTLHVHRLGAALVAAGRPGWGGGRLATVALLGAIAAVLAVATGVALRPLARAGTATTGAVLDALARGDDHPVVRAAALPFRIALAPLYATDAASWLLAAIPAVVVLGVHLAWVLRGTVPFEEAAAAAAAPTRRRRGRSRSAALRRSALPLPRWGPPATAILWKNLLGFGRAAPLRVLGAGYAAAAAGAAAASFAAPDVMRLLGATVAFEALLLTAVGPLWVRNDLRADLQRLDLLRPFPLRGPALVAAEVLSSGLVISALQLLALLLVFVGLAGVPAGDGPTLADRALLLGLAALVLPVLNTLASALHNGLALAFPGWVRLGPSAERGLEGLGQAVLVGGAALLVLALLLVVPAAAAVGLVALLGGLGAGAAVAGAVTLAVLTAGETVAVIRLLGGVYDRLDAATVPG